MAGRKKTGAGKDVDVENTENDENDENDENTENDENIDRFSDLDPPSIGQSAPISIPSLVSDTKAITTKVLRTEERLALVYELKLNGMTDDKITKHPSFQGSTKAQIGHLLRQAADKRRAETRLTHDQYRQVHLDIHDRLLSALLPKLDQQGKSTAPIILKILRQRADLLGLDAPKQQQVAVNSTIQGPTLYLPDNGRNPEDPPKEEVIDAEFEGPTKNTDKSG